MAFNLVRLSQQDPRWKTARLGFSSTSTIGEFGCALTSVAIYLSGFGYPETPQTLNEKLKQRGGYVQDAIVWAAISNIYPKVRFKNLITCRDTDAPIDAIANAIAAGQPVILEVDSSPKAGLQTHWVVAYQKVGKDFLILDPWPFPTEEGQDISLMSRYSQGKELKRAITAVVWYECLETGAGAEIPPATAPADGSFYVRIKAEAVSGLRIRSAASTNSNTLSIEYPNTFLKVIEAEATARPKVGVFDQWLRVRTPQGVEGYCAAWFVETAPAASPAPLTPPAPEPSPEPEPVPTQPEPAPVIINRIRPSVGDGLENVSTPAPANRRLTPSSSQGATHRLVADIWNRYGGYLSALSDKMGLEPGVAVSVLAIESGGQAFGPDGRLLIRFENHLFYNYWGKNNVTKFNQHFTFDPNRRWEGHRFRANPSGAWIDFHGNQSKEWDVFQFACNLDDTAAKNSISMGAPQIMGFNSLVIGYASVQDMFTAFARSDRDQVLGFFDFINNILPNGGAVGHLRRKDFTAFATIYNGSGQANYYGNLMKNGYEAFNQLYSALPPVTPPQPEPLPQPEPTPQPEPAPAPPQPIETPPAPPEQEKPKIYVTVSRSLAPGGVRMRKIPSLAGALVSIEPAGASLRLVKPEERAKIGQQKAWLQVRNRKNQEGHVAAWLVEPDPAKSELNTAISFSVADFTEEPAPYRVHVSSLAGRGGLRLRKQPTSSAEIIRILAIGTPLDVLEDVVTAQLKVGRFNEWLKVREPLGAEGYAAAWFLEE
ncbi:MAG: hypothetical protein Fur0016_05420 [Anaerolineales bacterium]